MTIHIPEWVLWLLAVPVGLFVLLFAVVGIMFLWAFRNGPGF